MTTDTAYLLKETLIAQLRNGRWRPGERLPAERQLMETFQVGRSTVRRALAQMKEIGLITQTVGSGTYVAQNVLDRLPPPSASGTAMPALSTSPAQLMEARMAFEPSLIDLVIRHANSANFAAMEECLRNAENATTFEQFEQWDGALHRLIAEATHNDFVISVFNMIDEVRERAEWGQLKKKSLTVARRRAYEQEHRALVAALRERDAPAARKAIVGHLLHVQQNLFQPDLAAAEG